MGKQGRVKKKIKLTIICLTAIMAIGTTACSPKTTGDTPLDDIIEGRLSLVKSFNETIQEPEKEKAPTLDEVAIKDISKGTSIEGGEEGKGSSTGFSSKPPEGAGDASGDSEVTEEDNIKAEPKVDGNIVILDEDYKENKDTLEKIEQLKETAITYLVNTEVQVNLDETDREIKEIINKENEGQATIQNLTMEIGGNNQHLDIEIKNKEGKQVKYHKSIIKIEDTHVVQLYLDKSFGNINESSIELYNNQEKTHYLRVEPKKPTEISKMTGEVVKGDIVVINETPYILGCLTELDSKWLEGAGENYSTAYRKYRLTLLNMGGKLTKNLSNGNIKDITIVNSEEQPYEIDTALIGMESKGEIKITVGAPDNNQLVSKYTLDVREFLDIEIAVNINNEQSIKKEEIIKADTIIKETYGKIFIKNNKEGNNWITSGCK